MAALSKRDVAVERAECTHGGEQVNHRSPQAHIQYYQSGADMCMPLIDLARRHNRRAKEMVRHGADWRAER